MNGATLFIIVILNCPCNSLIIFVISTLKNGELLSERSLIVLVWIISNVRTFTRNEIGIYSLFPNSLIHLTMEVMTPLTLSKNPSAAGGPYLLFLRPHLSTAARMMHYQFWPVCTLPWASGSGSWVPFWVSPD